MNLSIVTPGPTPSPAEIMKSIQSELGIELFLILICVLIICYSLGLLTLHVFSWIRKTGRARKNSSENARSGMHDKYDYGDDEHSGESHR